MSAVIAVGCGGGEGAAENLREEQFAPIREQKAALDAKRQEVADLEARIAAAEEAVEGTESAEGEAGETVSPEELQDSLEQVRNEVEDLSEDLMAALVEFLNSANLVQGEAPTGVDLEAIRMKSAEDMVIAQEYIDRGGDYRRAIEILQTALVLDPENPELEAAKAEAEEMRYMTEERFAVVKKGMRQDEVRSLLGTVYHSNVREYPEKNVVAWFYRREDGGAAGVYFEEKNGEQTVYRTDFNAVGPPEEEGEEEGEAGGEA